MEPAAGKVFLVGAGPGDPGLLTLRGQQLLAGADLVLYDYLVNRRILDSAASAEQICLGRHGQGRMMGQAEIHQRMIQAAAAGRSVVRLKGGDPALFARAAEEIAALEAAGVDYEIVPGVTAVQAASSYAGIPLTHRDHASCVALVTGQQGECSSADDLDFAALAQFPGTLVIYMGVTTAPRWTSELIAHGKPPDTPVAVIRHASLPTQQSYGTTLADLPAALAGQRIRPPAIVIVGDVVAARSTVDWFSRRPLFGKSIVVSRPAAQAGELAERLDRLGAEVMLQPAIEIGPAADPESLELAIAKLDQFDWIVFSSANGVCYFCNRLLQLGYDVRALATLRIASIGPGTTNRLREYSLAADLQPDEYRAEALADALVAAGANARFLLIRASRGRDVLEETLQRAGGAVVQAVAYESRDAAQPNGEVAAALRAGRIDWITVTSSAIARSLVRLFGDDLKKARLAAISPLTADVLTDAGYPPAVVADPYTTDGVVAAMMRADQSSPVGQRRR